MKKLIAFLLLALLLTGCGSTQVPDAPKTAASERTATEPPNQVQTLPSISTAVKLPDKESKAASSAATQTSKAELPAEAAKPTESVQPPAQPTDATTPPEEASPVPTEAPPPTEAPTEDITEPPTEAVRWDTESAVASICAQTNAYAESVGLVVDPSCGSWITPLCTRGIDQSWASTYCLDYIDFLYSGEVKATRVYCTYARCPDCNDGWAIYVYY